MATKTKAQLQAEVDQFEDFKRAAAKEALKAIIANGMCEIGLRTIRKMGLGPYLPVLYWAEWRDHGYGSRRYWNKMTPVTRSVRGARAKLRTGGSGYKRRIVQENPDGTREVIAEYAEYEHIPN